MMSALNTVYNNNIKAGLTKPQAIEDDIATHISSVLNNIPQLQKIVIPMVQDVSKSVSYKMGEMEDVDVNGQLMHRHRFRTTDYIPFAHSEKDILSDFYYKYAQKTKRLYEAKIGDIMNY